MSCCDSSVVVLKMGVNREPTGNKPVYASKTRKADGHTCTPKQRWAFDPRSWAALSVRRFLLEDRGCPREPLRAAWWFFRAGERRAWKPRLLGVKESSTKGLGPEKWEAKPKKHVHQNHKSIRCTDKSVSQQQQISPR